MNVQPCSTRLTCAFFLLIGNLVSVLPHLSSLRIGQFTCHWTDSQRQCLGFRNIVVIWMCSCTPTPAATSRITSSGRCGAATNGKSILELLRGQLSCEGFSFH